MPISVLRPRLLREDAVAAFGRGFFSALRRSAWGPLRAIADVYLPFHLYSVRIANGGRREERVLALDAVSGTLDLYGFDSVPEGDELVQVRSRNHPEPTLDVAAAGQIVSERVLRMIYTSAFLRVRDLNITADPVALSVHIPYWVGFYGTNTRAYLVAIDAVRGQREGAKMQRLLENWLSAQAA